MPPTIPESDFEAMDGKMDTSDIKKYVYDIKFEVVMKEGTKTIPGKMSLVKAMTTIKNAKRKHEKIDFFVTNGLQISPDLRGIEQDEIEGRFCMEVGGFDDNNLFFACTIQTNITFSVLKGRTIDDFKKHNIYFKIHKGGFKYGVNWSPLGFFLKQHPGFTDNSTARDNLMTKITTSWNNDNEFFDNDQKTKISKIIDPDTQLESFDPSTIPFEIIQTSIFAKNSNNESVRANAVVVTIPFQFFKVGITIMDYMAITSEIITNYIPLGYKKEEPDNFFNIVYDHGTWLEKVRHVTITNVPTIRHFTEETNSSGKTLEALLSQIPDIDNTAYICNRRLVQVAILSNKMQRVSDQIKSILTSAEFQFKPQVAKKFNPNGSLGSSKSGTSKYSAIMSKYQTERSPNASVATSYGEDVSRLTGHTGRSWGTQRKIPKEIDFTDETEFPPIQPSQNKSDPNQNQPVQTTLHDESITDTTVIQQAIDSALKKAYEEHRKELADLQEKFNKQLELIQQQQNTTTLEMKFDKLMEMLTMDKQHPITSESPIRKKGRPNNLENTAFSHTETPTRSNCHANDPTEDTPMLEDSNDEEPMGPHFKETATGNENSFLDEDSTDSDSKEGEWITKSKKEKKFPRMTQTKIVDMMMRGGYGQSKGSPSRKDNTKSPSRPGKHTPPRAGKGTLPRGPSHFYKADAPNVHLTKLSSTRSGQKEPLGREN